MRHEHSFVVSPLVGPLVMGSSAGCAGPVAPTELRSLEVSKAQAGDAFPCAQTFAAMNTISAPNGVAFRMRLASGAQAYTTDQRTCRGRKRRGAQPGLHSTLASI